MSVTRRGVLAGAGAGALVLSFGIARAQEGEVAAPAEPAAPPAPDLPGSLADTPRLSSWIRVDPSGAVTVCTGKAELGQGMRTAVLQVAAEELGVAPSSITLLTADTGETPNEGFTAGSQSMSESATAVRNAAAQVRDILARAAAGRWSVPVETVHAEGGAIVSFDGRRFFYGALVSAGLFDVDAQPTSRLVPPDRFAQIGRSLPRVDIPGKVTGAPAYVHDMRPEGMLHARVVRPPSATATLDSIDVARVEALPGVVKVVRDGRFLGVVAETEFAAVEAMRVAVAAAAWTETAALPNAARLAATLQEMPSEDALVVRTGGGVASGGGTVRARFTRPYQMHASIGPSCAVAEFADGRLTVRSHTQGVFPDRKAIAEMMALPETQVRVVHVEGSGCYGHNGADDAAADAALLARAVPGRPVRVQWTREQEFGWEPYGPAMVVEIGATLGADGRIAQWRGDLWSPTHSTRPGPAGNLLPARLLAQPFAPQPPKPTISRSGNGDRNSVPYYAVGASEVHWHFLRDMPLRVSALRGLGAYANVFAIESVMDDLAAEAGRDPVEFRLQHLEDPRARVVVERAAEAFAWGAKPAPGRGHGFAFGRYKNFAAYFAIALEASVDRTTGRIRVVRAQSAIDAGQPINPNGLVNQTEGGILQSISWTLYEAVRFDTTRVTSIDWSTYPILRFGAVPDEVGVAVIDRPGDPFLGAGEAAQGPTAGALGNAVKAAIGVRLRDLPFTRDRVLRALAAPEGAGA